MLLTIQAGTRTIQAGVTLGVLILLAAAVVRPQQTPAVGPVWEFSSVSSSGGGGTSICYANNGGCRYENPGPSSRTSEGLMMAAAKLGEKGWELAGSDISNENRGERILYFKRLKGAINRDR